MIEHQISNSYGNYNYNVYIYRDILWDLHFHGNYELIYVMKGSADVSLNAKNIVLSEGELILVPPYAIHSLRADGISKVWVAVFSEDFIYSFSEKYKSVSFSKFRCETKTENMLKDFLFHDGEHEQYLFKGCLYIVCNECIKNAESGKEKSDDKFIYRVVEYISEHIEDEITMHEISNFLNYEYHYFSSVFNQCFGMNFKSFVNMFRFEKACRYLSDKTESITDVCNKCGFGSIRNFNRVFKQLSGYTPGEYRKLF